jgi:hypothetical protein
LSLAGKWSLNKINVTMCVISNIMDMLNMIKKWFKRSLSFYLGIIWWYMYYNASSFSIEGRIHRGYKP